jgi:hypothetical protein
MTGLIANPKAWEVINGQVLRNSAGVSQLLNTNQFHAQLRVRIAFVMELSSMEESLKKMTQARKGSSLSMN